MGMTVSTERNEGKVKKVKEINTDSPFISTETYNFIQENNIADTPISNSEGDFYSYQQTSEENLEMSELPNSEGELFVKSNQVNEPTIISLEGLTQTTNNEQVGGKLIEISIEGLTPTEPDTFDINSFEMKGGNKKDIIVLYGMNCLDKTVIKKAEQLIDLGFSNIYIYMGGLFEWLLLQEIYGEEFLSVIINY